MCVQQTIQKNLIFISLLFPLSQFLTAQVVDSDQWSATDALERKVREYPDTGDKRDKYVAMNSGIVPLKSIPNWCLSQDGMSLSQDNGFRNTDGPGILFLSSTNSTGKEAGISNPIKDGGIKGMCTTSNWWIM